MEIWGIYALLILNVRITSSFSSLVVFSGLLHRLLGHFCQALFGLDLKHFRQLRPFHLCFYGSAFSKALHKQVSQVLGFS